MIDRCEGNKKLLADAQMMLADTRCKIDYIRMQQLRLRNMKYGIVDENCNNFSFLLYSLPPTKEEVYIFARVCLSVCLSFCDQDYSKTPSWIWMKCCMSTDVGTWTNWLAFEPDPDYSPDAGTGLLSPISYVLQCGILSRLENPTHRYTCFENGFIHCKLWEQLCRRYMRFSECPSGYSLLSMQYQSLEQQHYVHVKIITRRLFCF